MNIDLTVDNITTIISVASKTEQECSEKSQTSAKRRYFPGMDLQHVGSVCGRVTHPTMMVRSHWAKRLHCTVKAFKDSLGVQFI